MRKQVQVRNVYSFTKWLVCLPQTYHVPLSQNLRENAFQAITHQEDIEKHSVRGWNRSDTPLCILMSSSNQMEDQWGTEHEPSSHRATADSHEKNTTSTDDSAR